MSERKPGRPVGAVTRKTREIAEAAAQNGITPLEWMLRVLRDEEQDIARRDDMAKAAAPYIHPRLSSIEANVKGELTIREILRGLD